MLNEATNGSVKVFSTCPASRDVPRAAYHGRVVDVARQSEAAGCEGILVYTDNGLVDPWLVAQIIVQQTNRLSPLVAVQPAYTHPYAVAKMVATIGHLHGRRIDLNMVAGGFRNDLAALGDRTPHDDRYTRLVEFTKIVLDLLSGDAPVTFQGRYYAVDRLRMVPALPRELRPAVFVSGTSDAARDAARRLGATAVQYPGPPGSGNGHADHDGLAAGLRVGVIARADANEAWRVARHRFPEDRAGQLTHQLANRITDSVWYKQLAATDTPGTDAHPYWIEPFRNYRTFCPYLVGSYERVGEELGRYLSQGYSTFILDIPAAPDDLQHTNVAFARAMNGNSR